MKIIIVVLSIAVIGGGAWYFMAHKTAAPAQETNVTYPVTAKTTSSPVQIPAFKVPTFALSPSSSNITVGGKFDVSLVLDTAGHDIDGVDIYQLHFDPDLLGLTDTPGTLMAETVYDKIGNGTFGFSQLVSPGTHYRGSGVLVTLHFRALKTGTAKVTIDYTPGASNQSNIAGSSKNLLEQVVNGTYIIK